MKICDESKCTGCFACINACPRNAIISSYGYLDKTIPTIIAEKCIKCGICQNVCPVNFPVEKNRAGYSIAAQSLTPKDLELSASGGIASVFSRHILENNGIVFGTTNDHEGIHIISITSTNEIDKLRGSKYVQSNVGLAYREIKTHLDNGADVLFISTPCQIAGLKNFLKRDYDNLILVDLICHGVPPQKYLSDHLLHITKGKEYDKISFRGKYDYYLTVYNSREIVLQKDHSKDYYFQAFLNSEISRDNCYECHYACPERCSDLTIGDFWGIQRTALLHNYSGKISVILPNTEKGVRFFNQCSNALVWEKRSIDEACNDAQGNLLHPSKPGTDRKNFEKYYPRYGFEKTLRRHTTLGKGIRKATYLQIIKSLFLFRLARKIIRMCYGERKCAK